MRNCTKLFGKGRYSRHAKTLSGENVIAPNFVNEAVCCNSQIYKQEQHLRESTYKSSFSYDSMLFRTRASRCLLALEHWKAYLTCKI